VRRHLAVILMGGDQPEDYAAEGESIGRIARAVLCPVELLNVGGELNHKHSSATRSLLIPELPSVLVNQLT
jgi:hypothetical protein